MTQLGEQIAAGAMSGIDSECPFDHRHPEEQKVSNKLAGSGSKLGELMAEGSSTVQYERYRQDCQKQSNPGHPFRRNRPIMIPHYQTKDGTPRQFYYPLTCAAHHLIPAQASLRECKNLLKYISSKNGKGDYLKGEDALFNGVVWNDIGYDVNGTENGVYLPGLYAVAGNGTGDWVGAASALDDEEETPPGAGWTPTPPNEGFRAMTDRNHLVAERSKKWQYVFSATRMIGGQFHDSHPAYSRFVLGILNKMGSKLNKARQKSIIELKCPKCKDRAEQIENLGVPPPYGLSLRLNDVSKRLKTYLTGTHMHGHRRVFTSRWGLAWSLHEAKLERKS